MDSFVKKRTIVPGPAPILAAKTLDVLVQRTYETPLDVVGHKALQHCSMTYTMCMKLQNEATSASGRVKVTPMRRLPAKPRTSSAAAGRRCLCTTSHGARAGQWHTNGKLRDSGRTCWVGGGCGGRCECWRVRRPAPLRLPTGNPSQNPDAPGEPNAPLPTKPALCPLYGDLHSWARLASPNQGSPGEPSLGSESTPRDSKNLNHGVLEIQKPPCEKHDPFVNKYSPCCGPLGAPAWR